MLSTFHVSSRIVANISELIPSFSSIDFEALLEKNITRKVLLQSLDLFFKMLLFQVSFLIFFSIAVFSPYFLLVGLLLQCVALFQSNTVGLSFIASGHVSNSATAFLVCGQWSEDNCTIWSKFWWREFKPIITQRLISLSDSLKSCVLTLWSVPTTTTKVKTPMRNECEFVFTSL